MRVVPIGTPLWPTYRRLTPTELSKSAGSSSCSSNAAPEVCTDRPNIAGDSGQTAVVNRTDSLKDEPFSKITHFDIDGQIYTAGLKEFELVWKLAQMAFPARIGSLLT